MDYNLEQAQSYLRSFDKAAEEYNPEHVDKFCAECPNRMDLHEIKHADICNDCEQYYNENGKFKN